LVSAGIASQEICAQLSVIRPARSPVTVLGDPAAGPAWVVGFGARVASGAESTLRSDSTSSELFFAPLRVESSSSSPADWTLTTRRGPVSSSSGEPVIAGTQYRVPMPDEHTKTTRNLRIVWGRIGSL
jgi:hypothetical protein